MGRGGEEPSQDGAVEKQLTVGFTEGGTQMNGIIYLIGLIVVILAILSFFGLR
jgi:hypothetical protein